MKLIKKEETYYLVIPGKSTNEFIASVDGLYVKHKLSIKNCEAIENGYDLEDLACDWHKNEYGFMPQLQVIKAYISGFQKAIELLGDKKYNYGHLDKMFTCGKLYQDSKNEAYCFDNVLSKFEQTEWEVEIVTKPYTVVGEGFNLESKREPKLDVNGCIVLKRKL